MSCPETVLFELFKLCDLFVNCCKQGGQAFVERAPDKLLRNVIVVVPIDVADPMMARQGNSGWRA